VFPFNTHEGAPVITEVRFWGTQPWTGRPFVRSPSFCGPVKARVDIALEKGGNVDYSNQTKKYGEDLGNWSDQRVAATPSHTGCDKVPFTPEIEVDKQAQRKVVTGPDGKPVLDRKGKPKRTYVLPAGGHIDDDLTYDPLPKRRRSEPAPHLTTVRIPGKDTDVNGVKLSQSSVQAMQMTLPLGVRMNPSLANKVQACTDQQLGFWEDEDGKPSNVVLASALDPDIATPSNLNEWLERSLTPAEQNLIAGRTPCPAAAKLGTASVSSMLPEPADGSVYMRAPLPEGPTAGSESNPFRILVAGGPTPKGYRFIKVPGLLWVDQKTGQLTARLSMPDFPFTRFELNLAGLEGSEKAADQALVNPDVCNGPSGTNGSFEPTTLLRGYKSWSQDEKTLPTPKENQNGWTKAPNDGSMRVDECNVTRQLTPRFTDRAGNPISSLGVGKAGGTSFPELTVTRPDDDLMIRRMRFTLPSGFSARLADKPMCDSITRAEQGTCPAASTIGSAKIKVGAAGVPLHDTLPLDAELVLLKPRQPGEIAALALVVDATDIGPAHFNLGRIAVGTAIKVNQDFSVALETDDLPGVERGLPLYVQQASIKVHDGFVVSPQTCANHTIKATIIGDQLGNNGEWLHTTKTAEISAGYQTTQCETQQVKPERVYFGPTGPGTPSYDGRAGRRAGYVIEALHLAGTPNGEVALDRMKMTSPPGVGMAAGWASKLQSCGTAQFMANPLGCPAASKIGEIRLDASVFPGGRTESTVHLGPQTSTDGSLQYRLFFAVNLNGQALPITGKLTVNPHDGRITTEFDSLPQVPLKSLVVLVPSFDTSQRGDRGAFVNPTACGDYHGDVDIVPAGAQEPIPLPLVPASAWDEQSGARGLRGFKITNCPDTFEPQLSMGNGRFRPGDRVNLDGGGFPEIRITRPDGQPRLGGLTMTIPRGWVGKLAGRKLCRLSDVDNPASRCPEAKVGEAKTKIGPASAAELDPNCDGPDCAPTVDAGIYLTEPRQGAVVSLAISARARIGVFDLGWMTIMADITLTEDFGLQIDTDPLPTRFQGVNLYIMEMAMKLEEGFMVAPTECRKPSSKPWTFDLTPERGQAVQRSKSAQQMGVACLASGESVPPPFAPKVSFGPGSDPAPAGKRDTYHVGVEFPAGNAAAGEVTIQSPPGVGLAAPVAEQLTTCAKGIRDCPVASILGGVTIETDSVGTLSGGLYLQGIERDADGTDAQYRLRVMVLHPDLRFLISFEGAMKLLDDGRIETTFTDLPPIPFRRMGIQFNGNPERGGRALTNPLACGMYAPTGVFKSVNHDLPSEFTNPSWRGATISYANGNASRFAVDNCERGFEPELSLSRAGGRAGARGDFPNLEVAIPEGNELLTKMELGIPAGYVGELRSRPLCADRDAALAAATDAEAPCADAEVGTVRAQLGPVEGTSGPADVTGKIFLTKARPNSGAVASVAIVVDATVGQFRLGKLAIEGDIKLTKDYGLQIVTDTLPTMHRGVNVVLTGMDLRMGDEFMINPARCGRYPFTAKFTSKAGDVVEQKGDAAPYVNITGCENVPFKPRVSVTAPGSRATGTPAALQATISMPDGNAPMSGARLELPEGVGLNPATALSTKACDPKTFETGSCPTAAKLGDAVIETATIGRLTGAAYMGGPIPGPDAPGSPGDPGSAKKPYKVFIRLDGDQFPGVTVRLTGKITLDAKTGQVTTVFDKTSNLPPLGFSTFKLTFSSGPRAALVLPEKCGFYRARATFTSAAADSTVTVKSQNALSVTEGRGENCNKGPRPFAPAFDARLSTTKASANAAMTVTVGRPASDAPLRGMDVSMPAGFSGIIEGVPTCPSGADAAAGRCDGKGGRPNAQIGTVKVNVGPNQDLRDTLDMRGRVYLTPPPKGASAGTVAGMAIVIDGKAGAFDLGPTVLGARIEARTDFGLNVLTDPVPAVRAGIPLQIRRMEMTMDREGLLISPTRCGDYGISATLKTDGAKHRATSPVTIKGCRTAPFAPSMSIKPTTTRAETPTGFDVTLAFPEADGGRHQSYARSARVVLSQGVTIGVPMAERLRACSPDQFRAGEWVPATCPEASKMGDVRISGSPVGDLAGSLYMGPIPGGNAPGSAEAPFTIYMVAAKNGIYAKATGQIVVDQQTGQVTTQFDNLPEVPFRAFTVSFEGGDGASLVNPPGCGTYTATATLTPWSGGAAATTTGRFTTDWDGNGGPCPAVKPFAPTFQAEVSSRTAGEAVTAKMTITRPERHQALRKVVTHMPAGMLGDLNSVTFCTQAELDGPGCPEASRVGTVTAHAGAGNRPVSMQGQIHLVEGANGSVARLAVLVPAKVGMFDLGVVRAMSTVSLRADGGLDVVTDGIETMRAGVPLQIRALVLDLNRPGFMRNPKVCPPTGFAADFESDAGATATVSAPYQVDGCGAAEDSAPRTDQPAQQPSGGRLTAPTCTKVTAFRSAPVRSAWTAIAGKTRVRLVGPATDKLTRTSKPATFALMVAGSKKAIRSAEFSLDGKRAAGKGTLRIDPRKLSAGRHVLEVRVTPKKGKAKVVKLPFTVRECPSATFTAKHSRRGRGAYTDATLTLSAGDAEIAAAEMTVPAGTGTGRAVAKLKQGTAVGTLTVSGARRTILLKVAGKPAASGPVTLANADGTTVRIQRAGAGAKVIVTGVPEGATGITLKLAGASTRLLRNPARGTMRYSAKVTGRNCGSATLTAGA
jgi:hypothetical protein